MAHRGPNANSGESSFQSALGAVSPAYILPRGIGQHVFGRSRKRLDQLCPGRINLQVTRNANGPCQAACREPLMEWRAEAVAGIRQHAADSAKAISCLVRAARCSVGTPTRFKRSELLGNEEA